MNPRTILFACGFALLIACDDKPEKSDKEDLTIVVEADRSKIETEEQKLKERLNAFRKEKESLLSEREELVQAKNQLKGKDKAQERRLRDRERLLITKEKKMYRREEEIEKLRAQLDRSKSDLLDRVAGGAVDKPAAIAARERSLAGRERGLSQRERDLASREKVLAEREAALARREAAFLKVQASLSSSRAMAAPRIASRAGSTNVSRSRVEKSHKSILQKMRRRGILARDLPLEYAGLTSEIAAARKEGDLSKMAELVEQFQAVVEATRVNAAFIERKVDWLNQLKTEKKPKGGTREKLSTMFRKATQLYSDGKYSQANGELNRIYALLKK